MKSGDDCDTLSYETCLQSLTHWSKLVDLVYCTFKTWVSALEIMDKSKIEKSVKDILLALGEDPDREGLKGTPKRIARMYEEVFFWLERSSGKSF